MAINYFDSTIIINKVILKACSPWSDNVEKILHCEWSS